MSRLIARLSAVTLVVGSIAASTNSAATDVSRLTGLAKVVLSSNALGGTTPTSTTKLQHSNDGSTGWTDVPNAAFAPVSAVASTQELLVNTDSLRKFVRVVDTLGGTSPTQSRAVTLIGTPAY